MGGEGNDILFAGAGSAILDGGQGADVMYGSDGADQYSTFYIDNAGDKLRQVDANYGIIHLQIGGSFDWRAKYTIDTSQGVVLTRPTAVDVNTSSARVTVSADTQIRDNEGTNDTFVFAHAASGSITFSKAGHHVVHLESWEATKIIKSLDQDLIHAGDRQLFENQAEGMLTLVDIRHNPDYVAGGDRPEFLVTDLGLYLQVLGVAVPDVII